MTRIEGRIEGAPAPAGPYSHSVRIGGVVAAAGQVGVTSDDTVLDGVGAQTRQALANIAAALSASGAGMDDVISVRVFLTEGEHFDEMNAAYREAFREPYPARTTVYVGLPEGFLVEIDALAVTS